LPVDGARVDVIQAPKLDPRIMGYELSDYEWTAIKPQLANEKAIITELNQMTAKDRASTHLTVEQSKLNQARVSQGTIL
jgi:hypothetical protein